MKEDNFEPLDGVFAVPGPKDRPRYNFVKLIEYCEKRNIKLKELTEKEKQLFVINKDIVNGERKGSKND